MHCQINAASRALDDWCSADARNEQDAALEAGARLVRAIQDGHAPGWSTDVERSFLRWANRHAAALDRRRLAA